MSYQDSFSHKLPTVLFLSVVKVLEVSNLMFQMLERLFSTRKEDGDLNVKSTRQEVSNSDKVK